MPRCADLFRLIAALAIVAGLTSAPALAQTGGASEGSQALERLNQFEHQGHSDQAQSNDDSQGSTTEVRARAPDDQSGLQTQIEQLGSTQEKPYAPPPPPDLYTPDGPPPPPTIDHGDPEFCCAREGMVITYPIVSDPLKPAPEYDAPRDPAIGGVGVYLHDGAFYSDATDLSVKALFYDINWTRHWRSDVKSDRGGVMGYGWDFAFNKRIVPISSHALANGLYAEQIGVDTPSLYYYDGLGRVEKYVQKHSEQRKVLNFDGNFTAWVTTYKSPPGQFHEIERYVVMSPASTHPFRAHPNVELTEQIFYVLRGKDGTRFVFDCRGQLIYILSRHDSAAHPVRVELDYGGELSPLTQNQTLQKIKDAKGRSYSVETTAIGMGNVFTFFHGQPVAGQFPIARIKRISGAGLSIEYDYKDGDQTPVLEAVEIKSGAKPRRWEYVYDGDEHITDVRNPNTVGGSAGAGPGSRPLHIDYTGQKVHTETIGDQSYTLTYGSTITVRDGANNAIEYALEQSGPYDVIRSAKITDANSANAGPWTTSFAHNGDTQVTEVTYPAGGGTTYVYEAANSGVTLGPIRDWFDHGLTYESNLAQGNLLSVTAHGSGSGSGPTTTTATTKYDRLYNQSIEITDVLNAVTRNNINDYDLPRNRGNPLTIDRPGVKQPDGQDLARPQASLTYDEDGQLKTSTDNALTSSYEYDGSSGLLKAISLPGGAFDRFEYDALGDAILRTTLDGAVKTERNALGQITQKTVDPNGVAIGTSYEYDNEGNPTVTTIPVRDTFGPGAPAGLKAQPAQFREITADYDVFARKVSETLTAGGLSQKTEYKYTPSGELERMIAPSLDGGAPYVTTFRYDARHRVREKVEGAGSAVARTTTYDYDANGNLTGIAEPNSKSVIHYNGLNRVDSSADPLGGKHAFVYDAAGNVVEETITGAKGVLRHTTFDYDVYGHLVLQSTDSQTGAPQVKRMAYSARLLLAKETEPNGAQTTYVYDDQGRPTDLTDGAGDKTHNSYDSAGHLSSVQITSAASGGGALAKSVQSVRIDYDSADRVIAVTTPQGVERRFLDTVGQVRGAVSASGQLTSFVYDGLGRQTDVVSPLMTQHFDYTPGGLVKHATSNGSDISVTFDALGRTKTRADNAADGTASFDYSPGQIVATDPNGTSVTTKLNAASLPVRQSVAMSGNTADVADYPNFRIVQGPSLVTFDYDELGRVTHASSGGSDVTRQYDGLDRVTEEIQSWASLGQTVKYDYADDFRSETITYPELSRRKAVVRRADSIGRVIKIEADGLTLADYDYAGVGSLADRILSNGVTTRFGYDSQERLVHVAIAAGKTRLWSALAAYDQVGPSLITEDRPAEPQASEQSAADDQIYQTRIARDAFGRLASTTTTLASLVRKQSAQELLPLLSAIMPGGQSAVAAVQIAQAVNGASQGSDAAQVRGVISEVSGLINTYDGANLKSVSEYNGLIIPPPSGQLGSAISSAAHAIGLGGDAVQSLRIDSLNYEPSGRVTTVSTLGGFNSRVIGGLSSPAEIAAAANEASRKVAGRQTFVHDANGNVVSDGRYLYAYDFDNRLIEAQDRWSPYGYREGVRFSYDAFGRRIVVSPERDRDPPQRLLSYDNNWTSAKTWTVYDGDHAIQDAWRDNPKASGTVLLASYVYGARPSELLAMERRPEASPSSEPEFFFLHEDFNGVIRYASDGRGQFFPIANEAPQISAKTAPEQAAGDANMIGDTGIRLPFLGGGLRIDGFVGAHYQEGGGHASPDYRVAHSFVRDAEHGVLLDARTAEQNKLQIVAAAIVATPIAISVMPLGVLGLAAAKGAAINVGIGIVKSQWNDEYYSGSDLAGDALQGAAFAVATGGVGQMGLAGLAKEGAELAAVTTVGTAWEVGVHGARLEDAFVSNLATAVVMSAGMRAMGIGGEPSAENALVKDSLETVETVESAAAVAAETHPEAEPPLADEPAGEFDPSSQTGLVWRQAKSAKSQQIVSCPTGTCSKSSLLREYARSVRDPNDLAKWVNDLPKGPRAIENDGGWFTAPVINPGRGLFNCNACSIAFDLWRRKGYVMKAFRDPPRAREGMIMADIEKILGGTWQQVSSPAEVESSFAALADGEGGVLYMKQNGAHVFNVVKLGGKVIAVDMQAQGLGRLYRGTVSEMLVDKGFTNPKELQLLVTH